MEEEQEEGEVVQRWWYEINFSVCNHSYLHFNFLPSVGSDLFVTNLLLLGLSEWACMCEYALLLDLTVQQAVKI